MDINKEKEIKTKDFNYYSNFYETYMRYSSGQWLQRASFYGEIYRELNQSSTKIGSKENEITLLEIGPGTGDVGALVAKNIISSGSNVDYRSIDRLSDYVDYPIERLSFVGAKAKAILKDNAFSYLSGDDLMKDLELKENQKLDIILCEHVLYGLLAQYKNEPIKILEALKPYLNSLSENGLFINLMSDQSDSDYLRLRSATGEPAINIYREILFKNNIFTKEFPISSTLNFPILDNNDWDKIAKGEYEYEKENQNFKDAHDLITFFGSNIAKLRESGDLESYLLRFRKVLDEKDSKLKLNVVAFISAPNVYSELSINLEKVLFVIEDRMSKCSDAVSSSKLDDTRILPNLHKY